MCFSTSATKPYHLQNDFTVLTLTIQLLFRYPRRILRTAAHWKHQKSICQVPSVSLLCQVSDTWARQAGSRRVLHQAAGERLPEHHILAGTRQQFITRWVMPCDYKCIYPTAKVQCQSKSQSSQLSLPASTELSGKGYSKGQAQSRIQSSRQPHIGRLWNGKPPC